MKPCRIELPKHDQLVGLDKFNQDLSDSFKLASPSSEYDSNIFTMPVLDIDLSYFESKELTIKTGQNSSNKITGTNLKTVSNHPDTSRKVYLDKLLEEIFINKSTAPPPQKLQTSNAIIGKDDDFFSSDKKCDITSLF